MSEAVTIQIQSSSLWRHEGNMFYIQISGIAFYVHMLFWLVPSYQNLNTIPAFLIITKKKLSSNCRRIIRGKCTGRPEIFRPVSKERMGSLGYCTLWFAYWWLWEQWNMTQIKPISMITHKKNVLLVSAHVAEAFKK